MKEKQTNGTGAAISKSLHLHRGGSSCLCLFTLIFSHSLSLCVITPHPNSEERSRVRWSSVAMSLFLQQCPSLFTFPTYSSPSSSQISVKSTVFCCLSPSPVTIVNGNTEQGISERNEIRLGLPSKGRMATDTLDLLKVVSFLFCSVCFLGK